MQNPNWWGPMDKKGQPTKRDKQKEVSRPSDAEIMLLGADASNEAVLKAPPFGLEGDDLRRNLSSHTDWRELGDKLSVPREDYLFATDYPLSGRQVLPVPSKPGQGMLQVQRWIPVATIDRYKEPVADWVVADILAIRGAYLGGRQLVSLPTWSSEVNKYVLRPAEPDKSKKNEPRRGVFLDPTKPGPVYAVVEVEGGALRNRPWSRSVYVDDDTAAEIMLLDDGGGLQVRSSYADRPDLGRAERERAWKAWIDKTERDPQSLPDATGGPEKKVNKFD